MGQEITNTSFSEKDFDLFASYLKDETNTLCQWYAQGALANDELVAGFEIESWLLNDSLQPALVNEEFLEKFASDLATPELAQFNLEFNNQPNILKTSAFYDFHKEMDATWQHAKKIANNLSTPASLLLVGTLPTLEISDLNENSMSKMNRYRALNDQIMQRRQGQPIQLSIQGNEYLDVQTDGVMLEASTTSFQLHTQVPAKHAHHYYNAAMIVSAPLVLISANSPYVFGKNLWCETRIPLFEQAIDTNNPDAPTKRVSFGSGYANHSILECFQENLDDFYVLLPIIEEENATLDHLRLHNGTIWRWNRPLLGFNHQGQAHIRIEHRTIPAGPTIADMIANAVFYYGLQHYWAQKLINGHELPDFAEIKDNFYSAAADGFDHSYTWFTKQVSSRNLLKDILLPQVRTGLSMLDINTDHIDKYLSIIEKRIKTQRTGTNWQREYVHKHNCDMTELTRAYQERQESGEPVHTWSY